MRHVPKPKQGEFAPYAILYIDLVPDDGFVLQHLSDNLAVIKALVLGLPAEKHGQPHAPGEWTVKEILVHLIDCERILAYRALRFARNDFTELAGFDQDTYTVYSGANKRSIESILDEYDAVRAGTLTLFNSFEDAVFTNTGTANKNPLSVRGAAYFIAGHELHHLNSIRENYA